MSRDEAWATTDDQGRTMTAMVHVNFDEEVVVSYELMAQMLTELGFAKVDDSPPPPMTKARIEELRAERERA